MNERPNDLSSDDSEWVPGLGAVVFACGVIFLSIAILAGAAYAVTQSRGYELAPVFIQRMLRH